MSIKALSEYTFQAKYAKYLPELKRRETWEEAVKRVFDMHRQKYSLQIKDSDELKKEIDFAEKQVLKKRAIGSQRALQFGGEYIFKHAMKLFNCSFTLCDRARVFQEINYVLLCGTGVGISVQKHHIKQLPNIRLRDKGQKKYVIADSIEGWSDAFGVLFSSYCNEKDAVFKEYSGYQVEFDFSKIRPKGALIANQFKAPGPLGLKQSLERCKVLVDNRLSQDSFVKGEFEGKLRPIDCYDWVAHMSDSVLSGGIRRSALITLFSYDDDEMMEAKTGKWFIENPQRARSNNSAVLQRGKSTKEQFSKLFNFTKEFGEPGFFFVEDGEYDIGTNPCCISGDALIMTTDGPKTPIELLGVQFGALVDGEIYQSSEQGFFESGVKNVYRLRTGKGYELKLTKDHRIMTLSGEWVEAGDLKRGQMVRIHNHFRKAPMYDEFISLEYVGQEKVYDCTIPEIHAFDANGLYVHNCEIGLYPKTEDGRSGFQTCNLSEINGKFCKDKESFLQACRAASIIGTLQAGYTDFKYLSPETQEITEREALLGVSITGLMDNPELLFDPEIQKEGAKTVKEVNKRIAKMLGINAAARLNCTKPSGCRPITELVTTDKGILTLEEIMENHDIRKQWDGVSDRYETSGGTITQSYLNGEANLVRIMLNYGVELLSTKDHQWFVDYKIDKDKNSRKFPLNCFKTASDIQVNDVINIKLGTYNNTVSSLLEPETRLRAFSKNIPNVTEIVQPQKLNEDICWLLGYFWGDGCLKGRVARKFYFIDASTENLEKVQRILKQHFNIEVDIKKCPNRNAYDIEFGSLFLSSWLLKNGIFKYNEDSSMAYIPRIIRQSSASDIIAFIAGMIDADGHVALRDVSRARDSSQLRKLVTFTTANKDFSHHFQQVAMSVGLLFGRSHNTRGKNLQKEKSMWLMQLSCHCTVFAMETLEKNSTKLLKHRDNKEFIWGCDSEFKNKGLLGKVLSVELTDEVEHTFDIETEDHWFYAGAVKSHNSASALLSTASGIHPQHAKRYLRRVQANETEFCLDEFKRVNPLAVEKSVWSSTGTDYVISFLCDVPAGAITKNQISALEFLDKVKITQQNWVLHGADKKLAVNKNVNHSVSVTVVVKDEEWDDVEQYIWENRKYFTGVSLLSFSGDKDYPQAPFTTVLNEQEILKEYGIGSFLASGLIVDGLAAFDNNLWNACATVLGGGENLSEKVELPEYPKARNNKALSKYFEDKEQYDIWFSKVDWVRRVNQFAVRYQDGDVKRTTYLLKDVYNYKLWLDLKREYKEINWQEVEEESEQLIDADTLGAQACSGGKCELF